MVEDSPFTQIFFAEKKTSQQKPDVSHVEDFFAMIFLSLVKLLWKYRKHKTDIWVKGH